MTKETIYQAGDITIEVVNVPKTCRQCRKPHLNKDIYRVVLRDGPTILEVLEYDKLPAQYSRLIKLRDIGI